VIVGFPGETEEEFETTVEFLERIHFYEMHIFKYSKRQGTRAAEMKDQIPEKVKTARSAKLIELGNRMSEEFRAYYLGREEEILFEEQIELDGKLCYVGFNREYVKAAAYADENLSNVIRTGTITEALSPELYAIRLSKR
jgi:threonylcarbamoyladenosine tRNA methylthiotransferase MtaB